MKNTSAFANCDCARGERSHDFHVSELIGQPFYCSAYQVESSRSWHLNIFFAQFQLETCNSWSEEWYPLSRAAHPTLYYRRKKEKNRPVLRCIVLGNWGSNLQCLLPGCSLLAKHCCMLAWGPADGLQQGVILQRLQSGISLSLSMSLQTQDLAVSNRVSCLENDSALSNCLIFCCKNLTAYLASRWDVYWQSGENSHLSCTKSRYNVTAIVILAGQSKRM